MKAITLPLLLILATTVAVSQTTGSGPTVLENGPTINPKVFAQVRYADQYSGSDLGAQINAAAADLGTAGGVIKIRRGSYSWTTPVTIDPRVVSLIGDGSPFVQISCATTECLKLSEGSTYSISQGGYIGGFTLSGDGVANQVGLEAGGVIGEEFEDIWLSGFSGTGSVGLLFYNSASSNGWMERTITRKIRLDNNTVGWQFKYNTANSAARSFGYGDLEAQCGTINSGQTCILMSSGDLYHSKIHFLGDFGSGTTFLSVSGKMYENDYNIFIEGAQGAYGIVVAQGGLFTGYGTVRVWSVSGTVWNQNNNSPSFGATARVVQGDSSPLFETVGDAGTISNFLGTGNTAAFYPQLVGNMGIPYASFGYLYGPNVWSPYVSMYSGQPNAFEIFGCPYNPASMASCSSVARVDSSGNVHAAGAFYANGSDYAESIHVLGKVNQYEAGDLLSIDPNSTSRFVKSNKAYMTTVAGIYSTKPGVLGSSHALDGAEFKDEVPLAINGIVPCKVSTENGAIEPGDLLVSSSTPGYAMKGTDRSKMLGAVVGKALGTLKDGKGVVSVLVTYQ
jgi:hypothetical protein